MRVAGFRLIFVFTLALAAAQPALAKELFNIKGIQLGATLEVLKEAFPEIEITAFENKAHCKSGDVVIENGSWFSAIQKDEFNEYSFKLIFIDGVQTVVREDYSYVATSVSEELFIEKIKEKYDIDEINNDNIYTAKDSMMDYKGVTSFVVPAGHYFKIQDEDVYRLKYASSGHNPKVPGELTHTIEIESQKYNSLDR